MGEAGTREKGGGERGQLREASVLAQTAGGRTRPGRTRAPDGCEWSGYLSEEAGDHLLEGVLVHLVHVHSDPHPRPLRPLAPTTPQRAQDARAPPRPPASTRGRPKGRGVFPPFSNVRNFIVPSEKQTSGHAPVLFRLCPGWAAGRRRRAGAGGAPVVSA